MASLTGFLRWITGGTGGGSYIGFYDIDGYFCAGTKSLSAGEYAEMSRFFAIKAVDITTPTRERQNQSGDDIHQGFISFPSLDPIEAAIQLGVAQQDRMTELQGLNIVDDDQMKYRVIGAILEQLPPSCLLVLSPAKEKVFGQRSRDGWVINLLHRGEIEDRGSKLNERQMRDYDMFMICTQEYRHPWGVAMTKDAEGTLGGAGIEAGDLYRIMLGAFRTDGIVTTIPLVKNIRGDHTTDAMKVWSENISTGVVTEVTAFEVDTSTTPHELVFGTIAVPAALSAGAHVVYRYQWEE